MKLRTLLLTFTLCLFALKGFSSDAATTPNNNQAQMLEKMSSKMADNSSHKLSFTEKLMLKLVNKKVEKMQKKMMGTNYGSAATPSIDKGVYIIVAILIPFLAVGLATNFQGADWLICLLLTFLFYLPGLIYALIKMKDYYG